MVPSGTSSKVEGEDQTPNLAKTAEGWKSKSVRVRTGGKSTSSGAYVARKALFDAFDDVR